MTLSILLMFGVLGLTLILFVTEAVRLDLAALFVMVLLPWLGLVEPTRAFSGLSSNAVVAIIGVMILGRGVERSGLTRRLLRPLVRLAGSAEPRLVALLSGAVGLLSGFIQNIGATVLLLPAAMRLCRRTRLSPSRLLMPLGFAAILGGTLTMVASSPLIVLNDFLREAGLAPFGLFAVTPLGLVLLVSGVVYFLLLGPSLLPDRGPAGSALGAQQELIDTWHLPTHIHEFTVPEDSDLVGGTREESGLWNDYGLNLLALTEDGDVLYAPWRHTRFAAGQELALLGPEDRARKFAEDHGLTPRSDLPRFRPLTRPERAGFAELIVPPRSPLTDRSLRDVALRKNFGVEPVLMVSRAGQQRGDFSDVPLEPGTILVVHGLHSRITELADGKRFLLATPLEPEPEAAERTLEAALCFLGALALILAGVPLSLGLLTGAVAMILLGVLDVEAAYEAVDWRTVFLLTGLIPLGFAMTSSGTAGWVGRTVTGALGNGHALVVLGAVGLLTTLFTLVMSNVAATVVLVPFALQLGVMTDVSPRGLVLLVAVCASNSFLLPTHQVNALLMTPGGYHSRDYLRAGSLMTGLFLLVAVGFVYLVYV